jgi:hypothetical protein
MHRSETADPLTFSIALDEKSLQQIEAKNLQVFC